MNYDLDMPPYVAEIADWLDDDRKVHSCNFNSAYAGFEIMMGLCRSPQPAGKWRCRSPARWMRSSCSRLI